MRSLKLGLTLALLAFATAIAVASPPEIRLNGTLLKLPALAELYPVPGALPGERGISLAEIYPPQLEAWALETGARSILSDDLGERLAVIFLIQTASGWDLLLDKVKSGPQERVRDISRLFLNGESCPEKSLEVWVSWEGISELKAELARWASKSGIAIKTVDVPSIKSKLITVARGGGKSPDLVMIQSDYLPDLSAAGVLQELGGLVLPRNTGKGSASFTLNGRLWAAPFYCDTQLVFYSTELIKSLPPANWTLADMERLAKASGAKVPAAWNAYSAYWFLPFVIGFGKDSITDAENRMNLRDPAYEKAFSWIKAAIDRGFLEPMERDAMMAYFTSGRAAFILSGSYSIPEFKALGIRFGVAPFPRILAGGKALAPLLDFKGFAISRTTKNPVLARRLIQYLSSPAIQARFCLSQGKLPANTDAWLSLPANDAFQEILRASYEAGLAVPPDPVYGDFKNALWKLLRLYFGGSMTLSETLEAARKIIGE